VIGVPVSRFCYADLIMEQIRVVYEEFKVFGKELVDKVGQLIHAGNVRRIILKDDKGNTFMEIPLTVATVGAIAAPVLAGLGTIAALIAKTIISSLRMLLESWQNAELANVFGQSIRANMLAILKLEGALKTLQDFDNASLLFFIGTILAWMLLGGAFIAAIGGIISATYNLTARTFGGIEIELREGKQ